MVVEVVVEDDRQKDNKEQAWQISKHSKCIEMTIHTLLYMYVCICMGCRFLFIFLFESASRLIDLLID